MRSEPMTINLGESLTKQQQMAVLRQMGRDVAVKVDMLGLNRCTAMLVLSETLLELSRIAEADPKSVLFIQAARDNIVDFQNQKMPNLVLAAHGKPKGSA
jgi:hypothetical protein